MVGSFAKNYDGNIPLNRGLPISCRYCSVAFTMWAPRFEWMFSDMSFISLQLLVEDLPVGD